MRVQLAPNVENIDESVEFYSKMFGTAPYKTKPGYANFEIEQPPMKLVLFESPGQGGTLNHLGVEVEAAEQVEAAEARISGSGLETTGVDDTLCCYAAKTETWVQGPDTRWEWYVKNDDVAGSNFDSVSLSDADADGACCAPSAEAPVESSEPMAAQGTGRCC